MNYKNKNKFLKLHWFISFFFFIKSMYMYKQGYKLIQYSSVLNVATRNMIFFLN